ncbi:hypothetical protein CapIbe_002776 [Capra ibex]
MQEDEQSGRDLQQYQSQAKQLFRKLNEQSPTRCTLEAGAMTFHYIIEQGVCYLVLCEAAFPKKLAFAYLEDLHSEFDEQHGKKVPTVSRPYSFIEFDTYIQKTKKLYIDSRARRNLGSINTELQDVQRIMVANIEEVLQRGEALSALDSKANNLSSLSKKYRQDAKYLNMRSTYAKLAAVAVFFIMLIVQCRYAPALRNPCTQYYKHCKDSSRTSSSGLSSVLGASALTCVTDGSKCTCLCSH